jgi:hypothetical protein
VVFKDVVHRIRSSLAAQRFYVYRVYTTHCGVHTRTKAPLQCWRLFALLQQALPAAAVVADAAASAGQSEEKDAGQHGTSACDCMKFECPKATEDCLIIFDCVFKQVLWEQPCNAT